MGLCAALVFGLALFGAIGHNHRPEHIEQLQYTITASGENGVQVTEVLDQDFGDSWRHGPQLMIPNDLGVVTNVMASSPDAPADIQVAQTVNNAGQNATRIRVGDPDVSVTGQNRYVISYVLPEARRANSKLFLDVLGNEGELPIEKLSIVFDGITLINPRCTYGPAGSNQTCKLADSDIIRVELTDLEPNEGVTISGEIDAWMRKAPSAPLGAPERRTDRPLPIALVLAAVAAVVGTAVFFMSRREGRNEVAGIGASDAAFATPAGGFPSSQLVTDSELGEMSTVEFAPPKEIEPWQGAAVLNETLNEASVTAWFSGAIAAELISIENRGGDPRLSRGPAYESADPATAAILSTIFSSGRDHIDLDGYDKDFSEAWTEISQHQNSWIRESGWWRALPPQHLGGSSRKWLPFVLLVLLIPVGAIGGTALAAKLGAYGAVVTGAIGAVLVPAWIARLAYRPLRASRTSAGSAYALQTASFKRFLTESEGPHVEWAWKNGFIRQYSAWAVALNAADAWAKAMERAGVPRAEIDATGPLMVHAMSSNFTQAHVAPAPSGGSGGSSGFSSGGFSGSSGGGGGGSSHGSW